MLRRIAVFMILVMMLGTAWADEPELPQSPDLTPEAPAEVHTDTPDSPDAPAEVSEPAEPDNTDELAAR